VISPKYRTIGAINNQNPLAVGGGEKLLLALPVLFIALAAAQFICAVVLLARRKDATARHCRSGRFFHLSVDKFILLE
jgi:hypothetical protein